MARRKQMSPMQRIPSGEIMESLANGTATSKQTSNARKPVFRWSEKAISKSKKTTFGFSGAGKLQLVICVAGIYASLYGLLQHCGETFNAHDMIIVFPGLSCKSASQRLLITASPSHPSSQIRPLNTFAFLSFSIRFNPFLPLS